MAPSFSSQAKKYSGNSTFQSAATVVFIGIVLLIWMLTNESYTEQQPISPKRIYSPEEKAKRLELRKLRQKQKQANANNDGMMSDSSDQQNHHNDDEYYKREKEQDEARLHDGNAEEDDPFHINHDENPRHHQQVDKEDYQHREKIDNHKKDDAADEHKTPEQLFNEAKLRNQKNRVYLFDLDKPRVEDEENFYHLPKSAGGVLVHPGKSVKYGKDFHNSWDNDTRNLALDLYDMFSRYDQDEAAPQGFHFYGTMCVGRDCNYIQIMIRHLNISIGHFMVVVNTDEALWKERYGTMMELYPGRFTSFYRPQKLSCAESWNLVTRSAMTQRPQPDQIFISNADWMPVATPGIDNNMERYAAWSRTVLHFVANRYYDFSSFSFTRKGYNELGYFDEVIYPALAEDVEFHVKAVSKGLGELGKYDHWADGSKHITRASAGDGKINVRNGRVARFDYILRKWNVRVPSHRDFAHARPYAHPWNNANIAHNNSWVVDKNHRKCADTGSGQTMSTGRCYYNVSVLQAVMPPGVKYVPFSESLTSMQDSFPGGYH